MEVIRTEFNKILMSNNPSKYLCILKDVGLLEYISPEIYSCIEIKQDDRYHKYDVFHHLVYTVDNCDQDMVLRLAGLLHDIGKPEAMVEYREKDGIRISFHKHEVISAKLAKNFLRRMKYDSETIDKVITLVRSHMFHFTREWTNSAIRKFIHRMNISKEYITEENIGNFPLFKLRAAERLGNGLKLIAVTDRQKDFERRIIEVYQESTAFEIKDLRIDGNKIMEIFNLKPGIQIGNILKFLLDKVLEDPKINNDLDLLKLTTEYLHFENMNKLTS
jgi:poly(A) polymerase/tRNA nucleotidyltransferase (CCA-adding enzyme)